MDPGTSEENITWSWPMGRRFSSTERVVLEVVFQRPCDVFALCVQVHHVLEL